MATAALLVTLIVALLLTVPGLRPVVRQIGAIDPIWIAVAVAIELASSVSFVIVFRAFFDRIAAPDARAAPDRRRGRGPPESLAVLP